MLRRLGFVLTLGASLLAVACSSGGGEPSATGGPDGGRSSASDSKTRVAETGGITVEATWLTAGDLGAVDADLSRYPLDRFVLVEVKFTTHSGDLNEIYMEEAAALRQGDAEVSPEGWVSVSDDSHHREGVLAFPRRLVDGPVALSIMIGEGEASLVWEAAPTA